VQALIVALVAVVVGYAAFRFMIQKPREERPEIIVRNRKLQLEHEKKWRRLDSDRKWKLDHDAGDPVSKYIVSEENSRCGPLEGEVVEVLFRVGGIDHNFKFTLEDPDKTGKLEPVLNAPLDLEFDGSSKKKLKIKLDPDGGIAKVRVDENDKTACSFTPGAVELRFKLKPS